MSDKDLNCEQRIDDNVSQCEEHLKVLFHALDEDYDDEDNAAEIKEGPPLDAGRNSNC